ncbi:DUF4829 domain-containing protein [Flavobacterium jumunjinense]|uniref:hypothetical protein n=1 Tax=Flavobacterium sp. TaxID=239 RepID=UPI001F3754DE
MKIFKKNKRKNYLTNIFIISLGFFIIVIFTNHIYKFTHNYIYSSYAELKLNKEVISENEVYKFLNEIYSENASIENDSLKFRKLMCFSIPHSETLVNLIDELPDSIVNIENKIHLKNQICTKTKLWDKDQLKKCWVLTPSDLKKIEETENDDYWENYRKLFGSGKSSNSIPIFNKSKTVAIIQIESQGDYLLGHESIIVYLRKNGKWKFYKEELLWIS